MAGAIAEVCNIPHQFYRSLGWEPPDVVLLRRQLGGEAPRTATTMYREMDW
jgi:hypothetical protein